MPLTRLRPLAPKIRLNHELSVVSPTHGRSATGSSIIVPYQAKLTAPNATPARLSCPSRRRTLPLPATMNVNASAGTIRYASSIFTLKASPTHTADTIRWRSRPDSSARTRPHAAPISVSTSTASGLLKRLIATKIGVTARISAAPIAARCPSVRLTTLCSTSTDPTPQRASGSSMLKLEKPKIRPESPISMFDSGPLSRLSDPLTSSALVNHALQLWLAACAASA